MKPYFFFVLLLGLVLIGCNATPSNSEEAPIARVYNDFIYPHDLEGLVHKGLSKADSAARVNAYIESWAKKILMQRIAEDNISNNAEIDEKVKAYKASLIQYEYEKRLVEKGLDSLVTDVEINSYYEKTKAQHYLKNTIARCYMIKVSTNAPNIGDLKTWWNLKEDLDYERMKDFADKNAQLYILDDSTWVSSEYLAAQLPPNTLNQNNLKTGFNTILPKDDYLYFLRCFEVIPKGGLAPVSYVKDKAVHYILHQRKLKLLDTTAKEIFERELNKNNVQIYGQ